MLALVGVSGSLGGLAWIISRGVSSFASYRDSVVHLGGFNPGVDPAPGLMCRRCAGPGGHSGRSCGIPGGGSRTPGCGSACRSRRWRRPGNGGSPRSAYRRFNQCGGGAGSRSRGWAARGCQRGMVVKAAGCAGQGILILAWLETRDHFNPFALRASEDFPVDVDRPT